MDFTFYVAMQGEDAAYASIRIDLPMNKNEEKELKTFYREHFGKTIKQVDGKEMMRLMNNYIEGKRV